MSHIRKKEGFSGQRSIVVPHKILKSHCEAVRVVSSLYLAAIGYYPNAENHYRQRPGGIQEHILIYCVSGRGITVLGRNKYLVDPGSAVLIPAHTPHMYEADAADPWTIYWIHFKGDHGMDYVQMLHTKWGGPAGKIPYHDSRIQLFNDLYASVESGFSRNSIAYAAIGLQYFLASLCFAENYLTPPAKTNDSITLCIRFMQQNVHRVLTLSEIAAAANLSASHLAAVFRKKTGHSVIEYFNQLKIQQACQYLQFTDLRMNEIAFKIGIEDPFYFSRMFTKISGMPPVKYRSVYRGPLKKAVGGE